jgi:hypothetical protein
MGWEISSTFIFELVGALRLYEALLAAEVFTSPLSIYGQFIMRAVVGKYQGC